MPDRRHSCCRSHRPFAGLLAAGLLASCLLLASCGVSTTRPPQFSGAAAARQVSPVPPGFRLLRDPSAGFALAVPERWKVYRRGDLPEGIRLDPNAAVTALAPDGKARITVARTPARDGEDMTIIGTAGRDAILAAYPELKVSQPRTVRLGGAEARELTARGRIGGTPYVVAQRLALHEGYVYTLTMAAPEAEGVAGFGTVAATFTYL